MPPRKKPTTESTTPGETPKASARKKPATPRKKAAEKAVPGEGAEKVELTTTPKKATRRTAARKPDQVPPNMEKTPRQPDNVDRSKFKDLLIVESPTKVKTIGKYLGGNYIVLASYGHVRDLAKGRKAKGEEVCGVQISNNWLPRYVNIDRNDNNKGARGPRTSRRTTEDILKEIADAAKKSNRIFLATDPDREGEAIAWHLSEALDLDPNRTFRITFNEITKTALQHALAHPAQINMDRVAAQEARRILDRVVGFPLSSYLRDALRLSATGAGRVQSVAVKLIADREREIEAFKSEEYWRILALLSPQGTVKFVADPKKAKIFAKKKGEGKATDEPEPVADTETEGAEEATAKEIISKIPPGSFQAELVRWDGKEFRPNTEPATDQIYAILAGASYVITKIDQTDKPERPQPPFTTSTLQQQASIRLYFTAQQTMSVAQTLYQGVPLGSDGSVGLITYMRTDSTKISNDAVSMVRNYIQSAYGSNYLPNKPNTYASGKSAQEAHEAIRPTDLAYTPQRVQPYLNPQQFRLYELIYNRFVASQMMPAIFAITNVEIEADKGLFKTQGKIEKFDGYRKVLPPRGKQEDVTLPFLSEKQKLDKLDLTASQHFTQPPPRFNEASLVKALEKEGIGRPSTYAAIIAKIQDHGHVKLEQRRFHATEIGKRATDLLSAGFPNVINVKFTSHIEEELDDIENAKIKGTDVLDEFWTPFNTALKDAKGKVNHDTGEMCPKCGKPLTERLSKTTGKGFVGCSGWKKDGTGCDYIKPGEGEAERPKAIDVGIPCPTCGKPLLQKMSRFGTTFLSCSGYKTDGSGCNTSGNLDAEGKLQLTVKPSTTPCPKCGKMLLLRQGKNGPFLACPDNKVCKTIVDADAEGNPKKDPDLGIVCEKCGSPMRIRTSFRGPFLSCSAYPKCRNAKSINAELKEKLKDFLPAAPPKKKEPDVEVSEMCPQCGGKMKVRMGRGKPFLGCANYPKCKGTMPCPPELLEKAAQAKG